MQAWLNESDMTADSSQPGWLKIIMSMSSLLVCYMELLFPPNKGIFGGLPFGDFLNFGGNSQGSSGAVTTRLSMAARPTTS